VVLSLRRHWIPRPKLPTSFFTLGVNGYLDLAGDPGGQWRYIDNVVESNARLTTHFASLLGAVRVALAGHLGEPATFDHPFAFPGMHIWESEAIPVARGASLHFDLQHEWLVWPPGVEPDRSATISFTLPLQLPGAGAALRTWDYTYEEFRAARRAARPTRLREAAATHRSTDHRYNVGTMVVHSGHVLHQIAPVDSVGHEDRRITLQGHGMRAAGAWHLYW
jgi:hypothetical protein